MWPIRRLLALTADGEAVQAPLKRSRAGSWHDEHSPKKRKTSPAKASDSVDSGRLERLRSSEREHSPGFDDETDSKTIVADLSNTADDASENQYTNRAISDPAQSSKLGNRPQILKCRSSNELRSRAESYLKPKHAPQSSVLSRRDNIGGIGCWTGSNVIPGSRKPIDNDTDEIEPPKKKLRQKGKKPGHLLGKSSKRGQWRAACARPDGESYVIQTR